MTDTVEREPFTVEAARLECAESSYSADRICEGKPISRPFEFSGSLWVCVSITGKGLTESGEHDLEAYRLVPPELFKGRPTTYAAKIYDGTDGENARNDPNGFYHSMAVKYAGKPYILSGPAAIFVAEIVPNRPGIMQESAQMDLFA